MHKTAKHTAAAKVTAKPKYAYPLDLFMWTAPEKALLPVPRGQIKSIRNAYNNGMAGAYAPARMIQAGIFATDQPLLGGIFQRREPVRFIVLHSTETERPADAQLVIRSWNHGMRHSGAQYVIDRDGIIYQAVDPAYAAVHVDIFRTQGGVNNDNTVGIEIVRSGKQKYTARQLDSVTKLVAYLQGHFDVPNENIVGHGQVQPSNRTDPVNFDWAQFAQALTTLQSQAITVRAKAVEESPRPE